MPKPKPKPWWEKAATGLLTGLAVGAGTGAVVGLTIASGGAFLFGAGILTTSTAAVGGAATTIGTLSAVSVSSGIAAAGAAAGVGTAVGAGIGSVAGAVTGTAAAVDAPDGLEADAAAAASAQASTAVVAAASVYAVERGAHGEGPMRQLAGRVEARKKAIALQRVSSAPDAGKSAKGASGSGSGSGSGSDTNAVAGAGAKPLEPSVDEDDLHDSLEELSAEDPGPYVQSHKEVWTALTHPPAKVGTFRRGDLAGLKRVQMKGTLASVFSGVKVPDAATGHVTTVWGSARPIGQRHFSSIVNAKMLRGKKVLLLSGTHGCGSGFSAVEGPKFSGYREGKFYVVDQRRFGGPLVKVVDVGVGSVRRQLKTMLTSGEFDHVVAGWCYSDANRTLLKWLKDQAAKLRKTPAASTT